MKKFMMFALLLGALSFGACVDDTETQSVTDVRNAKAEQLKAAADLANAQAAAAKTQAEAQKALAEAQAEYQKAMAEAAKIAAQAEAAKAEAEAAKAEAEAAVARAQAEKIAAEAAVEEAKAAQIAAQTEAERALAEANLKKAEAEADMAKAAAQKAQAEAEAAEAQVEAAKAEAEAAKKQAELDAATYVAQLETLKLQTEAQIAELEAQIAAAKAQMEDDKNELVRDRFAAYKSALEELNTLKKELIEKQYELALTEVGYVSAEEANQKLIAEQEEIIARYQNEIEAYKEYKGYDKAELRKKVEDLASQYNNAMYEFETNPVLAAIVATNEPIKKAFNDVQDQTELVENVYPMVLNVVSETRTYEIYRVVTATTKTIDERLTGVVYTEVSVNEAEKTRYENRLAHDIELKAEVLGKPEDRYDMPTAYGYLAAAEKEYDEAVANLEQVRGEFSEVIEAYEKAKAKNYETKDASEAADAAAEAAVEAAAKAQEAATEAQAKYDEAAQKVAEAAAEFEEAAAKLSEAIALPIDDPTREEKIAAAQAANDAAKKKHEDAKADAAAAKKTADEAKKAADEANKAAQTANEAAQKAAAEYSKAQQEFSDAETNKGDADIAVRTAEETVAAAQEQISEMTTSLNNAQTRYDKAVKAQQDFAEAFAALDIEAVLAATAALDEAYAAREEAWDAFDEAMAPIMQIRHNYLVAEDMYENCNAIDVEEKISEREQWIADCQEKIAEIQAAMTDDEANNDVAIGYMTARITELEGLIETQTGIVEAAKASLDAALAE